MRKALRLIGFGLLAVVVLLVLAGAAAYVMGGRAWTRTYDVPTADLTIPTDDSSVARGRHLAGIYGCVDCHGQDLGGGPVADGPPFLIHAPNLTSGRGGIGSAYTPTDWDRSIRHGVRPNGEALFIMPSRAYNRVADSEIVQLIAYLRRVPPVDREHPAREIRPLGRLLAAGPMDPSFEVMTEPTTAQAPPVDSTVEYGTYVTGLCAYCHGDELRGAPPLEPEAPPAPDLGSSGQWPYEVFAEVLRTGVRPDGRRLNPAMPWSLTARMTDVELRAVHMKLQSLGGALPVEGDG